MVSGGSIKQSSMAGLNLLRGGFFLLATLVMVCDAWPRDWCPWLGAKDRLSVGLSRCGLWQGEWAMFAPNPVLNNAWVVAELEHSDGTKSEWSSPNWSEIGAVGKFRNFRQMNYFSRIHLDRNRKALPDLIDWIVRAQKSAQPIQHVKLFRNEVQLILSDDEELPLREDATWIFSSQFLTEKALQP
jgi:hypothetical protein